MTNKIAKQITIKTLNDFLAGNYMAIEAYENYIQHIDEPAMKNTLQQIQQNHKQHAMLVAERIQNLGGEAVHGTGMQGSIAQLFNKIKGPTDGIHSILKDALAGEQRGIKVSQELVKGDLDAESMRLVQEILNDDVQHVELLHQLIQHVSTEIVK